MLSFLAMFPGKISFAFGAYEVCLVILNRRQNKNIPGSFFLSSPQVEGLLDRDC